MPLEVRFSQLSKPRQTLVRLCQFTNFGNLTIFIRDREPFFNSESSVQIDVKLDCPGAPRHELTLNDFVLCEEFHRCMKMLDEIENGRILKIEIRAGLPRRILFDTPISRLPLSSLTLSGVQIACCEANRI